MISTPIGHEIFAPSFAFVHVCAQSCPTFCDPRDCSPSGSSIHGISQARRVVCHFFLQGIDPNTETYLSLLCLLHWLADSLPLSHLGSPVLCPWICFSVSCFIVYGNLNRICILLNIL